MIMKFIVMISIFKVVIMTFYLIFMTLNLKILTENQNYDFLLDFYSFFHGENGFP